jgi:3-phosphoshikimate 1-carboxyvinyltransferase
MAGAVLGLGVPGIDVLNAATVGKTFPDFTVRWAALVGGEEP